MWWRWWSIRFYRQMTRTSPAKLWLNLLSILLLSWLSSYPNVQCYPIIPMYPPPLMPPPPALASQSMNQLLLLSSGSSSNVANQDEEITRHLSNVERKHRSKQPESSDNNVRSPKHNQQSIILRFNSSNLLSNSKLFNHIHWLMAPELSTSETSTTEATFYSSTLLNELGSHIQKRIKRFNRYYDVEVLERWQDNSIRWFRRFWDRLFGDPAIDFENDYVRLPNVSNKRVNRSNRFATDDDNTLNRNVGMSPRLTVNDRFLDVVDSQLDQNADNRSHSKYRSNNQYDDPPGDDLYDLSRRRYLRKRETLALPIVVISILIVGACVLMVLIEVKFSMLDSCLRVLDENNESMNDLNGDNEDDSDEDDDSDDQRQKRRNRAKKKLKIANKKSSGGSGESKKKKSHSSSSKRSHRSREKKKKKELENDNSEASGETDDSDDRLSKGKKADLVKLKRKRSKSKDLSKLNLSPEDDDNDNDDAESVRRQKKHRSSTSSSSKKKETKVDDDRKQHRSSRHRDQTTTTKKDRHDRFSHRRKKSKFEDDDDDEPEPGEDKSDTGSAPTGTGTATSVSH